MKGQDARPPLTATQEETGMGFRLPKALQSSDDGVAVHLLQRYYRQAPGTPLGVAYSGARFDHWDSCGSREASVNKFTSDDLVAVTFLGVDVPPKAAWELLCGRPAEFNGLLAEVPELELADVDPSEINPHWAAWRLWQLLRELRGVDWVVASKLLARKRPMLVPIYDRVVKSVTGGDRDFWTPLCTELQTDNRALDRRLQSLRGLAGLDASIPTIRVFDVIAWMEGKDGGL
jgi:hypothetical protein